jgi:hypothetical protein
MGFCALDVDNSPFHIKAIYNAIFVSQSVGIASRQVTQQFFPFIWIVGQYFKQDVSKFGLKFWGKVLNILRSPPGKPDFPASAQLAPNTSSSE